MLAGRREREAIDHGNAGVVDAHLLGLEKLRRHPRDGSTQPRASVLSVALGPGAV